MPVQKFKTFEDAQRALWLPPGDPRIQLRLQQLATMARPIPASRGVSRFRSIDEAKAHKWVRDSGR